MRKKYVLISLEDEKTKHLSEVLGSAMCKKIIDALAEEDELSEKDLADKIKAPINTIEYNLNKLLKAELIEKSKRFFWSSKGRKIDTYTLSNKSIIIQPKSKGLSSKIKSILPVAIISGIGAMLINYFYKIEEPLKEIAQDNLRTATFSKAQETSSIVITQADFFFAQPISPWAWFLVGAGIATMIFLLINWRKI